VEFLLCFECDHLEVRHNGESVEKDCPAAHAALVKAIQAIFPTDSTAKGFKPFSQPKSSL